MIGSLPLSFYVCYLLSSSTLSNGLTSYRVASLNPAFVAKLDDIPLSCWGAVANLRVVAVLTVVGIKLTHANSDLGVVHKNPTRHVYSIG
jgi:hypothetical protein